jgi:CRP-like cAMP-binding protein
MLSATSTSGSSGRNRLLTALTPADFSLLASKLKNISLSQGELLQEAGEPIKHVYFPQSGMISLLTVMQNGSAVETATVGREGAMGAMSGLGSRIAPHRAVVRIEGTASRIAAAPFEAAVNGSASIKELIVRYSDFLMIMIQQSAGCSALHSDLDLACLNVKDGIRRVSLREDLLVLPVVRHGPPAVHGAEEHLHLEGTF